MTLDFEQLKQILDLVRDHQLSELEIEHEGLRLRVRTDGARGQPVAVPPAAPSSGGAAPAGTCCTATRARANEMVTAPIAP